METLNETTLHDRGGQHEAPSPIPVGLLAICRRETLPVHGCRLTGERVGTPWVATANRRAISVTAIQTFVRPDDVREDLLAMLELLNRELPDVGKDTKGVGLVDTTAPEARGQRVCSYSFRELEVDAPVLSRGRFDVARGLGPGYVVTRVGHYASHVMAPGLASLLDQHYGTPTPEQLYAPAELRDQAAAAKRQADADARATREESALSGLATAMFSDDSPTARDRAKSFVTAFNEYRALTAR